VHGLQFVAAPSLLALVVAAAGYDAVDFACVVELGASFDASVEVVVVFALSSYWRCAEQ
jgi:hypothetical protein